MILSLNMDRFVYFDEAGEITTITNYQEDTSLSFVKVDYSLVEKIMEGIEPSFNYMVVYDIGTHEYGLIPKIVDYANKVNDQIHEIQKITNNADFTITQDIKNSCWKFSINSKLRAQLEAQRISIKTPLFFSITKKHDPHVLYRTLTVMFSDIFEQLDFSVPFVYNNEHNNDLSIYTVKKLQSYKHEVIYE